MGFEGRCQTLICFYDEAHIAGFGTADRIFFFLKKKHVSAFHLEADEYKWLEGQENWQVKSISAGC